MNNINLTSNSMKTVAFIFMGGIIISINDQEDNMNIRKFKETDLPVVMQIWLDTNIQAHNFISPKYWEENFQMVKSILPQAEVYVYEEAATNEILGFIGLTDNFVAGLFVRSDAQSKGIGKQLLDYAKAIKNELTLTVYAKNTRAINFYHREQFTTDSEKTDDNTGEKEFILVWKTNEV